MRGYFGRVKQRLAIVKMLHIGLNSGWWHLTDIVFVITGEVL